MLQREKYKRKKEHANNFVVFLLAFVIFLVVFGSICLWAVIKINQERQSASEIPSEQSTDAVRFDDSDARNLLIVTVDNNTAQGFVAVRFNPVKARIRALAMPRDTAVDYKAGEIRLYELYDSRGASATVESLSSLTGIKFDNYLAITYENIGGLVEYLESGVILTLDENLEYNDDNLSINMSGGPRTLSANQVIDVLRYPAWRGGRKQRSAIQAQIISALINQYMRESRLKTADNDFTFTVNHAMKTDILISHYKNAKEMLGFLAKLNNGDICTALTLPGEYRGSKDAIRYYTPDDIKEILKSTFD